MTAEAGPERTKRGERDPLECPRCGGSMPFEGRMHLVHLNLTLLEPLRSAAESMEVDVHVCQGCGKVEFYA